MSATYILVPNFKPNIHLVTEVWEADGNWVVGEYNIATKGTTFRHRSYPTLGAAAESVGVSRRDALRRKLADN